MSVGEAGTWKLIIYPVIIIIVIGLVLNLTVKPFIDSGVAPEGYNSTQLNATRDVIMNGLPLNIEIFGLTITPTVPSPIQILPTFMQDYIGNQVLIFAYIPLTILIPLLIILSVAFIYVLWVLVAMWVP